MEPSTDDRRPQSPTRRRPLVVGVGQTLRGDDAVGRCVADALLADNPKDMDVLSAVQLVPELAEPISKASAVVFVDARVGGEPGSVAVETLAEATAPTSSSHCASPESLLQCAASLFGRAPPAALVSVSGGCFELGAEMSPQVKEAVPAAVRAIRQWLAERSSGDASPG